MPPKVEIVKPAPVVEVEINPEDEAKALALDVLVEQQVQQTGELCATELVHDITERAADLFISRHYDLLAVNYSVLGAWESMMQVVETSLMTHDRGVHQYDHQIQAAHEQSIQAKAKATPPATGGDALAKSSSGQDFHPLPHPASADSVQLVGTPEGAGISIPVPVEESPGGLSQDQPNVSPTQQNVPAVSDRKLPRRRPPAANTGAKRRMSNPPAPKSAPSPTTIANIAPEEGPPFDPEDVTRKTWRAGTPPGGVTIELHSRYSICMKVQQKIAKEGKEGSTGRLSGVRKSRYNLGASMAASGLGASHFGASGRQESYIPTETPLPRVPRERTRSMIARDPQNLASLKTPLADKGLEPKGGESGHGTPAVAPIEHVSAQDLELQEEVSQQRARRQELVELREKLTRQLQDKGISAKNFQIDGKTGTVIPTQSAEMSAKKSDITRFNVNVESSPAQATIVVPTSQTGRPGARLNTAPAGSGRPKEGDFFIAESGGVAMVVEVPLAGGVGLHEANGTQRKNDYTQPKNRISRGDYKKIIQQHNLTNSNLPEPSATSEGIKGTDGKAQEKKKEKGATSAEGAASAGEQANQAALTAASLAKHLPAPPAKTGRKSAKGSGTSKQPSTARSGRPRTSESVRRGGSPAPGYPISVFPKRGAPPKMTPRATVSTPRSPRRMQHSEVTRAIEKIRHEVQRNSPPRTGMRRNHKAEEEGLIEDLLSDVDEDEAEHRDPTGPLFA